MKKSYFFRNSLLPLLGALAVMCAGSCSQEILEVSDNVMPETRAASSPLLGIACDPLGVSGPDGQYFAKDRVYTFNVLTFEQVGSSIEWTGTDITVEAVDGSDDAIDILLQTDSYVKLRFTHVGVYRVHVIKWYFDNSQDPAPIMSCETTQICRVPSSVSSIDGPTSVMLGGEYSFKVHFDDPDYPDPTLNITESVFNDPKYTILSNDGAGNYRIRFDQPGDYTFEPGVGKYSYFIGSNKSFKMNGPEYYVKVFFRPEMELDCIGQQEIGETDVTYLNRIYLYDTQHHIYLNLPFRLYFKYEKIFYNPFVLDEEYEFVSGVKGEVRINPGELLLFAKLPETDTYMKGLYYAGTSPSVLGDYWKITIPRDTCYYWDGSELVVNPGEPIE